MATDIKLDQGNQGEFVQIEGKLKAVGSDFELDQPARRRSGSSEFRRALVHNNNDGLTINFSGDYPGGVTVEGSAMEIGGKLKATGGDFMLDAAARRRGGGPQFRRALVHNSNDGLSINFNGDYPDGVTVESDLKIEGELKAHIRTVADVLPRNGAIGELVIRSRGG